ncbi:MAG: hypothetical protein Q8P84_09145 [Deltaproteobacteria bacterium]|nr:hypothetical protein [Deltaproteobacteria bacterium]
MKTRETESLKLDTRTRERMLRNGSLSKEEFQKHLKSLPDEANNAEEVAVFEEKPEAKNNPGTKHGEEPTFSAL